MWECKHCKKLFSFELVSEKANHSRWCEKNPKIKEYKDNLKNARVSKKNFHNQFSKAKKLGLEIPDHPSKGKPGKSHPHTEETKKVLREKALSSSHRRILRSTRKYIKKDGSEILLDSSWEEVLAKRLDELNIKWIRPIPVQWKDKLGNVHNYFPDFYLEDYDLYLDPKNDQVYKISIEKIEQIKKILPNLKILRSLDECKNFSIS